LKVPAETPEPLQGETTEKPIPIPNHKRTIVRASAETAPAAMAGQLAPDVERSVSSSLIVAIYVSHRR